MKTVIIEDKQRIESIILQADACFVGITDLEGNPYVVPMNFGYENGIIYLHSSVLKAASWRCWNIIIMYASLSALDINLSTNTKR